MATMKRCRAQLSLSGSWGTEHLWDGLEVDVDRELAPGFTVGQAIAGREDCFEDVFVSAVDDVMAGEPGQGTQIAGFADGTGEPITTAAVTPQQE